MKKNIAMALYAGAIGYGFYAAWQGNQFGVRVSMAVAVVVVLLSRFAQQRAKNRASNSGT